MKKTVAFSKNAVNVFFHILTRCNLKCRHCYINPAQHGAQTLPIETIKRWLAVFIRKRRKANVIFLGGEPTLHPEFEGIITDTIYIRDSISPDSKIVVLSNASMIHKPEVYNALGRVDKNVLKLDTGLEKTFMLLNQPLGPESPSYAQVAASCAALWLCVVHPTPGQRSGLGGRGP